MTVLGKERYSKLVGICFLFLAGFLLYLVNFIPGVADFRRIPASFFEPITFLGVQLGSTVKDGVASVSEFGKTRQEVSELHANIAGVEAQSAESGLLVEEVAMLRRQLNLGSKREKRLEAKVIGTDDYTGGSYIILNKGNREGVKRGDVVEVGNVFLGVITETSARTSKVMLPRCSASSWKVKVVPHPELDQSSLDEIEAIYEKNKPLFVSGVILGGEQNVRLENIPSNYSLERGQAVVTFDERVGDFYVVGYVGNILSQDSDSSKSAYVEPILDYDHLRYVFVRL